MSMGAIDEFPHQEAIILHLAGKGEADVVSAADIAKAVGTDRQEDIDAEVAHLVNIGLARRSGDGFQLTGEGREAAARFA
jgi:hypothetical protein